MEKRTVEGRHGIADQPCSTRLKCYEKLRHITASFGTRLSRLFVSTASVDEELKRFTVRLNDSQQISASDAKRNQ